MFSIGDTVLLTAIPYPKMTGKIVDVYDDLKWKIIWDPGQAYLWGVHPDNELLHIFEQLKIWNY